MLEDDRSSAASGPADGARSREERARAEAVHARDERARKPMRCGSRTGQRARAHGATASDPPSRERAGPRASDRAQRRRAARSSARGAKRARSSGPPAQVHRAATRQARRRAARRRRLGARDQDRRLSHPDARRERQGHALHAQGPRLDARSSARSPTPRSTFPTASSTAKSPRSRRRAS